MSSYNKEVIRSIVRSSYAIQDLRIKNGNRVCAVFRSKLEVPGDAEVTPADAAVIFGELKRNYDRISDAIASDQITQRSLKKIQYLPGELIENLAELTMAEQYFMLLKNEQKLFGMLELVLREVPIYTQFLEKIPGIGPQMAGILISEIDIHKTKYPSGLHALAGLDVVRYAYYVNAAGQEKTIRASEIDAHFSQADPDPIFLAEGKYPVEFRTAGRNRRDYSLVKREYTNRAGEVLVRDALSFNPWLKTKLIGVLAGSFLKRSEVLVDGKPMGSAKRHEYAKTLGYSGVASGVDAFLETMGIKIEKRLGHYAKIYYDYKARIQNQVNHQNKTPLHQHNMSLRYMIKMFLIDYYKAARAIEGLVVYPDYATAKLGLTHGTDPSVNTATSLNVNL